MRTTAIKSTELKNFCFSFVEKGFRIESNRCEIQLEDSANGLFVLADVQVVFEKGSIDEVVVWNYEAISDDDNSTIIFDTIGECMLELSIVDFIKNR